MCIASLLLSSLVLELSGWVDGSSVVMVSLDPPSAGVATGGVVLTAGASATWISIYRTGAGSSGGACVLKGGDSMRWCVLKSGVHDEVLFSFVLSGAKCN